MHHAAKHDKCAWFLRFKPGRLRRTLQRNRTFFEARLPVASATRLSVDTSFAHQRFERVLRSASALYEMTRARNIVVRSYALSLG
jgi:hypothetical protein